VRTQLLATAAVLAFAFTAGTAQAAQTNTSSTSEQHPGHPLMKGLKGPEDAAQRIERSLKDDPSGNGLLAPGECTPANRSRCATPNSYLEAIVKWHSDSGITKAEQLPAFFRSLSRQKVKGGWYLSSRMIEVNGKMVLDLNSGFKRELRDDEFAWYDTQTGKVIALEDCANIALLEVEEVVVEDECAEVIFPTQNTDGKDIGVNIPVMGNEAFPKSTCWGIKWSGTTKYDRELPDQCPEYLCNMQALVNATGRKLQKPISEVPEHFGTNNILYVPKSIVTKGDVYTIVFCWTKSHVVTTVVDGVEQKRTVRSHSNAVGIRSVHFVKQPDGKYVATVLPSHVTYPK